MITIGISSQKGGVGKTTVTVNLAYAFARMGKNVLIVDADPQGSVGLSLTKQTRKLKGFFDYLADPDTDLESVIVPTRMETLSLVPAGQGSNYEPSAGYNGGSGEGIAAFLEEAESLGYDLCLVDTAAGLFGITQEVLNSIDAVLIPQQAEPLGVRSMPKMLEALRSVRETNSDLIILGVLLTMVQYDLRESMDATVGLRSLLPDRFVLKAEIPRDDMFIKASARGVPVGVMAEGDELIQDFNELRVEIENKLALYI